jgi:hypothetical protein
MLALFALPLAADTLAPLGGEVQPAPSEGETAPGTIPTTPYEACIAETSNPVACEGVPGTPPLDGCSPGGESLENCEVVGVVPEPEVNQAALMAAEEAAADAVADTVAEEGSGVVDDAAAYIAALGAAREAAREAGADEATAEAVAETAAIGAVAREAASEAAEGEGSGAVDGAAAYIAALGAVREAGTAEESAPIAADRAVAALSDEAGSSEDEASYMGNAASAEEDEESSESATPTEGETSPSGEEASLEVLTTALPVANGASSLLVLGAGALLVAAGIVGLLIRRRLALQRSRKPEQAEEDTSEQAVSGQRLPQRSIR